MIVGRLCAAFGLLLLLALAACVASPTAITSPIPTIASVPSPAISPPATSAPSTGDGRFGACFFGQKLNRTDLPCAELQKVGIQSSFFGAWRGELEPQPGEYDWSSLDPVVDGALKCGVQPMLKITTASGPGKADDAPPQDMAAYSRFVSALAQHFRGRVRSYAIENEVGNSSKVWTAETYEPLLATAREAIQRADPTAQVLDGLVTLQTSLIYRAHELYTAGRAQEAVDMLVRYKTYMRREARDLPTTQQKLVGWLEGSDHRRIIALMDALFAQPNIFDAVQIHYLQDAWELIPETISWVRNWAPNKPYEFWEIGFGWEGQQFTEENHAAGVVKTLIMALGEGADRVVYEPYYEDTPAGFAVPTKEPDAPRLPMQERKNGRALMTAGGPRLAATAYEVMARQLGGYTAAEPVAPSELQRSGSGLGAEVWAYRFVTPRGDVYVVWAGEDTTVTLPIPVAQVAVTDITGRLTTAAAAVVPIGPTPVFVSAP
jgi:hypothetical protein